MFTLTQATQPGITSTGHQIITSLGHCSLELPQELPAAVSLLWNSSKILIFGNIFLYIWNNGFGQHLLVRICSILHFLSSFLRQEIAIFQSCRNQCWAGTGVSACSNLFKLILFIHSGQVHLYAEPREIDNPSFFPFPLRTRLHFQKGSVRLSVLLLVLGNFFLIFSLWNSQKILL